MHSDFNGFLDNINFYKISFKVSIVKQRVITAILFGIVFIGAMLLMNTIAFPVFVSILSCIAVWEIEKATALSNKLIIISSIVFSAIVPFLIHFGVNVPIAAVGGLYVIFNLILMLVRFEETRFEQAVIAIFSSVCVPYSFSLMIVFRDIHKHFDGFTRVEGIFMLIFVFFASWMTDIFAYFVGSKLGKHKLCPKISPKKTVEGLIGGILGAVLLSVLLLFVFKKFFFEADSEFTYLEIALFAAILSGISVFGDLAASTIKRNFGVKDFGNLLPGHGGIMDRFDSALFVMPVAYAVISLFNK